MRRSYFRELLGPLLLVVLVCFVQFPALINDGSHVIGRFGTDVDGQFVPWRNFGFDQLRHGNLALWNPHLFCGTPFFGAMQSALLYPLNFIFLFLPVGIAINWNVAMHVAIAGIAMYAWARYRGISRLGATLAGGSYMFSGAFYLHVMPGHLPWLCVTAWAPLLLMCCDGLLRNSQSFRDSVAWLLFGSFILSLQILAGYPQPIYIALLSGSLYLVLKVCIDREAYRGSQITRIFLTWIGTHIVAALLCAIQLGATLAMIRESARSGGTEMSFAGSFSIPPRNFLTLILPYFWGSGTGSEMAGNAYTGVWLMWEITPFIGVCALALAALTLLRSEKRMLIPPLIIILLCVLISLGDKTPLHPLLYRVLPGFSHFRAPARWMWMATLWISLLVGQGFDYLKIATASRRSVAKILLMVAIAILVGGGLIKLSSYAAPTASHNLLAASGFTFRQYLHRGIICLLASILLFMMNRSALSKCAFAFLLLFEMTCFAKSTFVMTNTFPPLPKEWTTKLPDVTGERAFVAAADYRNIGMNLGIDSIWGYDPLMLRRYVQFIAATQGFPADDSMTNLLFFNKLDPPIFTMLRCRCYMAMTFLGKPLFGELREPMPRFAFFNHYEVAADSATCLTRVISADFNPRSQIMLETSPPMVPTGSTGSVKVLTETPDDIELEAQAAQPTILLMTDAYSDGWQIRSLSGSAQDHYDVLPANFVLRAISLSAGHHHFILQYRPRFYVVGKWISLVTSPLYLLCVLILAIRKLLGRIRRPVHE